MFNKKHIDLKYGLQKELEFLPVIKNFFNDPTIYKLDKNNEFDFKGDNKFIELKSRRNNYKKYPTTMVGLNKFEKASKLMEEVYFMFSFDDGLYYYKYEKADQFEIKQGGRFDRGAREIKDYVFIPVENLLKII